MKPSLKYIFENFGLTEDKLADAIEVNSLFEEFIDNLIRQENVLDKMGKKKVAKSMRRGFVGGGAYTEFPSKREKEVVGAVSKNLQKKPYSHNPPMMGVSTKSNKKYYNKDKHISSNVDSLVRYK